MSRTATRSLLILLALSAPAAAAEAPQKSTEAARAPAQIVASYVEDFRSDRFADEARLFGVEVPGHGAWHVRVTGESREEGGWGVELAEGPPPEPTFVYKIEAATLAAIDRGEMNALTAQGKAFAGDYTPMSIVMMEGFEPSMDEYAAINPFSFHFWTRGFPELVPFGEGMTRRAHGGNFVVLYYETGLRTAWFRVMPGDRVRDDPREQAAPFPMIVVGIRGTATGEVDGKPATLPAGNAVFIPANTTHKWWNETGKPAEAVLIMFGEGA